MIHKRLRNTRNKTREVSAELAELRNRVSELLDSEDYGPRYVALMGTLSSLDVAVNSLINVRRLLQLSVDLSPKAEQVEYYKTAEREC